MPYDPKRLPLIEFLENRDNTLNRDCKMQNSVGEQSGSGTLHTIKRPGNHLAFQGVVGVGQGVTNYLNSLYAISGDFLSAFSTLAGLTAELGTSSAAFQARTGASGVSFAGKLWIFGGQVDPAVAVPTFSSTILAGAVDTISIVSPGLGHYPGFPTTIDLTITGGGGSGATATATIVGQQVTSVSITNGGTGYTSPPSVTAATAGWGIMNDVWNSVDGINWTQVAATSSWGQRQYSAAVVFDGKMYLTGGTTGIGTNAADVQYGDVWWSTDGISWTNSAAAPFPKRFNHGIEVFNNQLWVAGGRARQNTTSNAATYPLTSYADVYSSADGVNWVQTNPRAPWTARSSFGFFTANNLLWVVGGQYTDAFIGATSDSWSSPDGVTWTRVSSNPFNVAASGTFPLAAFTSPGSIYPLPPPVTVNNTGTGGTGALAYAFTDFDDDGDDDDWQGGGMVAVTFSAAGSGYTLAPALSFGASVDNAGVYAFLNGAANDGGKVIRTGRIGGTTYLLEFFANSGFVHRVWSTTNGTSYTNLTIDFTAGWPVRDGTWITPGNLWFIGGLSATTYYNDTWFISLSGTATNLNPDVPQGFFHFTQTSTSIATPLLVFKSTTDLYSYNAALNVLTKLSNVANYPQTTVPGIVYLDGYFFVMDPQGRIWNSAINDPATWTALGVIAMQNEPNGGVAIAKLANYVVGFGQWTIEFFYDEAVPAPASPLLPNQTLSIQVGCAAGESVVEMQASVVWIGQTRREGRGVYMFNGFNPVRISTPFVDRILQLDDLNFVRAYSLYLFGHPHYVLYLAASNLCLVYDFSTSTWSPFTSTSAQGTKVVSSLSCDPYGTVTAQCTAHGYSDGDPVVIAGASTIGYNGLVNINVEDANTFTYFVTTPLGANLGTATAQGYNNGPFNPVASAEVQGIDYVQDPTNGAIYAQVITDYDDHGNPIDFQVVTGRWDAGNSLWKFVVRGSLVCDMVNSLALIAHSDDDYQTFGSYRFMNLAVSQRPSAPVGGRTRRRAFKIRHTAPTPFRAEALELEFFFGSA